MTDYFEVDICELCKHIEYYSWMDTGTYRMEYNSRCLKGHKRDNGDVLECDDFEKEIYE